MQSSHPMRHLFGTFIGLLYVFIYTPLIVLIIFSFNNDPFSYHWVGFTTRWYTALFQDYELWVALKNSLIVATSSVLLSISIATMFIYYASKRMKDFFVASCYLNIGIPEIVLAVSLLSLFRFFGVPFGLMTLIVAHTVIGLGYVVPIVYHRYISIDRRIIEAAYDLGATEKEIFRMIIFPLLLPALISAGLLFFIVSFDDFLLSFFCSGASVQTLPLYIFSLIRAGTSPMVNALSTVLLVISTLIMVAFVVLQNKKMDMV